MHKYCLVAKEWKTSTFLTDNSEFQIRRSELDRSTEGQGQPPNAINLKTL